MKSNIQLLKIISKEKNLKQTIDHFPNRLTDEFPSWFPLFARLEPKEAFNLITHYTNQFEKRKSNEERPECQSIRIQCLFRPVFRFSCKLYSKRNNPRGTSFRLVCSDFEPFERPSLLLKNNHLQYKTIPKTHHRETFKSKI